MSQGVRGQHEGLNRKILGTQVVSWLRGLHGQAERMANPFAFARAKLH